MTTKARLVRIGNSRNIRATKEPGRFSVQRPPRPRMGWAELALFMAKRGHDDLLDEPTDTRFDRQEWRWK